jgi:hypothetical protein
MLAVITHKRGGSWVVVHAVLGFHLLRDLQEIR